MLSRDDILALLNELAGLLEARGLHGDLFIVGGAAMALAYNARRATRDLDAVFEPKQVIYQAAEQVAEHHGLCWRSCSPLRDRGRRRWRWLR
jgi:methylmalonyl-CoA mutase cobalamin-binding subunit